MSEAACREFSSSIFRRRVALGDDFSSKNRRRALSAAIIVKRVRSPRLRVPPACRQRARYLLGTPRHSTGTRRGCSPYSARPWGNRAQPRLGAHDRRIRVEALYRFRSGDAVVGGDEGQGNVIVTSDISPILRTPRDLDPAAGVAGRDHRLQPGNLRSRKSLATISALTASRASPPLAAIALSAAVSRSSAGGGLGSGVADMR
jgi:hypothetical protein